MAAKAMTKTQIVSYMAEKANLSKKESAGILEELADLAVKETKKTGQFVIPGIGKLVKSHRKARKGRNPQFTADQQAAIVAIACENPDEESQRPLSQWTHQEIAEEAAKREIVSSISASRVGAFLKSGRSQAASSSVLAVCQTAGP